MSSLIWLYRDGDWALCGTDPTSVLETITTAQRFREVLDTGTAGLYWIRGNIGDIGGIYGANPAEQMVFAGHPDGTGKIGNLWMQNCSMLRFERLGFTSSVELRMHTVFTASPHHIEFYRCVWEDINVYFCIGISNTFAGSTVDDILIDSCTFRRIPVAQNAEQDYSAYDTGSGDPGFDNNYSVYLIGGNGQINRITVRNCLFSELLNDAIQLASADDILIENNTIELVAYYSRTVGGRHADPLQSQTATNVVMRGNRLMLNDQPVQLQDGNHDWLIENNLIVGTHGPGFGFGHFWGHAPGDPYGGPTDVGVWNMVFQDNTIWDVGTDDAGYPAGLWRGAGYDNTFATNLLQRGLGGGQAEWDVPVGVGDGYQFSSGGDNLLTGPLPGASPADVTSPNPGFAAMSFERGSAGYMDPANWVPTNAAHANRGFRP